MLRNRLTTSVLALLIACAALSCAPDSRQDSLLGPETSDVTEVQSQEAQADSALLSTAETADLTPLDVSELQAQGFTVIEEPPPPAPRRSLLGWLIRVVLNTLAKVIGVLGGTLNVLGHILDVPAGAVDEPTIFTMTALQNGYVEVELTATPKSLLRRLFWWRPVEEVQFAVPVELSLTYARATNVPSDLSRLKIMRINPNGQHEILPSVVDPVNKTVTAELDHFSRYCLIAD